MSDYPITYYRRNKRRRRRDYGWLIRIAVLLFVAGVIIALILYAAYD